MNAIATAFDRLAPTYDTQWTNAASGRLQREAVWRVMDSVVVPGMRVLDLGCGTGKDALHLVSLGADVDAIDASPEMVRVACDKGVRAEVRHIESLCAKGKYDLVLSNFGALNCVGDLKAFGRTLVRLVKPDGIALLCLLNRFCMWETAFYSSHGKWKKSLRRLQRTSRAGIGVDVYYHSSRHLRAALAPEFTLRSETGIGISVPPSYGPELSPHWLDRCARFDRFIGSTFAGRLLADHRAVSIYKDLIRRRMILLLHPRAAKPKNRRFPLAILSIAAVLEGREEYEIVDGNLDIQPLSTLDQYASRGNVELLAVSVMPGPQMVEAIKLSKQFRNQFPSIPIVWGGYFPSLQADAVLNAPYVDYAVRGQGEDTILELLEVLRGQRKLASVAGLSFVDAFGLKVHNPGHSLRSPNEFPWLPYHRLGVVARYLLPTFLGRRTAVHQASIGCPFRCQFCGVVPIFDGRQKTESPERTAAVLGMLQRNYGIDAVQFYDNNFYLNESHAAEQSRLLTPLNLRWWSEGRIDSLLRYSDETLRDLRRAGATMIFFGAESGSDAVLEQMNKRITTAQTLELAERIRKFDIIPEFSFVVGNPATPEQDTRETIEFVRRIKRVNPRAEIIVQHYTPTPHPDGMYGGIDGQIEFPNTPDEWASERWYNYTIRNDPRLPWLPASIKRRIDNFELVVNSRWPTVQDIHLPTWGRLLLSSLSSWRYALGIYDMPFELELAQKLVALRKPRWESL